jgi:hypothetical protein
VKRLLVLFAAVAGLLGGAAEARTQVDCNRIGYACATVSVGSAGSGPGLMPGSARVTSVPAGIDCEITLGVGSGTCSRTFEWPAPTSPPPTLGLELIVTARPGSEVCYIVCTSSISFLVTLSNGAERGERFQIALVRHKVDVTKTGDGTGVVASWPGGIDCGSTCSASFFHGTSLSLTAVADAGAEFRAWTGACAGQGATCILTIAAPTTTNAVFGVRSATPPGPAPPPPAPPAPVPPDTDRRVDADVRAHSFSRTMRARFLHLQIVASERLAATLTLTRLGKAIASRRALTVDGRRVVTLAIPARVAGGRARVVLELRDAAGNRRRWSKPVVVPRSRR